MIKIIITCPPTSSTIFDLIACIKSSSVFAAPPEPDGDSLPDAIEGDSEPSSITVVGSLKYINKYVFYKRDINIMIITVINNRASGTCFFYIKNAVRLFFLEFNTIYFSCYAKLLEAVTQKFQKQHTTLPKHFGNKTCYVYTVLIIKLFLSVLDGIDRPYREHLNCKHSLFVVFPRYQFKKIYAV